MDADNASKSPLPIRSSNASLKFRKAQRVLSGMRFKEILHQGHCKADHLLVVCAIETQPNAAPRVGITIPKKTGNAVTRNHWKRLIREAFRTQQCHLPLGFDFIVRPKRGSTAKSKGIQRSLLKLALKTSINRHGRASEFAAESDSRNKPES